MIQLYTGVPGAGKTYKMVADLDAFLAKEPEVNLIANIRDLKLPHDNFDDLLMEAFPDKSLTVPQRIEKFFDYDFQKSLNERYGGPIMYVLDECQLYFPRRTSLPVTEAYLQRHRHLGHYLYLATQQSKLINSNIVALIEVEYYAVRRSISFFGEMHYRVKSPQSNQIIEKFAVRPKRKIFNLYKSFEAVEITKPKRKLWLKLWPLMLLPLALFFFYDRVLNAEKKAERLTGQSRSESQARPAVSSAPVKIEDRRTSQGLGMTSRVEELEREIEQLKQKLNTKERVFLTIVKVGEKRLTVDPDTQAVVDLSLIRHKYSCLSDGLICYYDRPVDSGIKVADLSGRGGSYSSLVWPGGDSLPSNIALGRAAMRLPGMSPVAEPKAPGQSPASFVDPSMVPAPETIKPKVYNGLED